MVGMKALSLAFYCAAGVADLLAFFLVCRGLPGRLRALSQLPQPEPEMPMSYNESLTAIQQMLAARSPVTVEAMSRNGFNELISALQAESAARAAADERLGTLSDLPRHRRDLLVTVLLVASGALLGIGGNIAGALA
jgi:hypothetical protein